MTIHRDTLWQETKQTKRMNLGERYIVNNLGFGERQLALHILRKFQRIHFREKKGKLCHLKKSNLKEILKKIIARIYE